MHYMKDPRLAEAYCDRMYDAEAVKQNGKRGLQHRPSWSAPMRQPSYDMYLSLIQARPLKPASIMPASPSAQCPCERYSCGT